MQPYINKVQQFLLTNPIWFFFAAIFFSSDMLLHQGFDATWSNYFLFILKISVAFSPVLIFVGFRGWFKRKLPLVLLIGIWIYCFIAHPYAIEFLGLEKALQPGDLGKIFVRLTGTLFLVMEIGIQVNDYWRENIQFKRWKTKISLEKIIWFSMLLFSIAYFTFGYISGAPVYWTIGSFVPTVFQIFLILIPYYCFYYINHYFLINKLLKEKGLIFYGLGFFATIVLLYPIAAQIISLIPLVKNGEIHPVTSSGVFFEINWMIPLFGMIMSIPFIMTVRWFRQAKELADLSAEKSETELNLLKQQINPHFFFNTLNNLYALSLTKDKQTPEVILQLSELMRYVIYQGKEKQVALKEEVKYIEDYVQLQQIRLHKKLDFKFEKSIEDNDLQIPPLLFITFVENAFKHGVEPSEDECFLHLNLKTVGKELIFICKNSFEEKSTEPSGIGLDNLKRRLALRFPKRHTLEIVEKSNQFIATLKITLSERV